METVLDSLGDIGTILTLVTLLIGIYRYNNDVKSKRIERYLSSSQHIRQMDFDTWSYLNQTKSILEENNISSEIANRMFDLRHSKESQYQNFSQAYFKIVNLLDNLENLSIEVDLGSKDLKSIIRLDGDLIVENYNRYLNVIKIIRENISQTCYKDLQLLVQKIKSYDVIVIHSKDQESIKAIDVIKKWSTKWYYLDEYVQKK